MVQRGQLIALEGIDGAGTTTQTRKLVETFLSRGVTVLETREPTDGPIGLLLRMYLNGKLRPCAPEAMALLFAADRAEHYRDTMRSSLESGEHVVCDRYVWSSFAYQSVLLEDTEWVKQINDRAYPPDLVVFLRVSPRCAHGRRVSRGGLVELYDSNGLQVQVAKEYEELVSYYSQQWEIFGPNSDGCPVLVVDGEQETDKVHADIMRGVEEFLEITKEG